MVGLRDLEDGEGVTAKEEIDGFIIVPDESLPSESAAIAPLGSGVTVS